MTVRSALLGKGTSGAGSFATIYTCPAGTTAILKDVILTLTGAGNTRAVVSVDSGPHASYLLDQALSAPFQMSNRFVVLEPGDQIKAFSTGGTFNVRLCGAELDGVAP